MTSNSPVTTTSAVGPAPDPAAERLPTRVQALEKFLDPMPLPGVLRPDGAGDDDGSAVRISLRRSLVRLHSQLPTTLMWTFEGCFPGPTVEAHHGRRAPITWHNDLRGPFPVTGVAVTGAACEPGRQGGTPDPDVAGRQPRVAVRFADSPEAVTLEPGGTEHSGPCDAQPASTSWYGASDPLDVVAGLAGLYLVRDDDEASLGLPYGEHEVPLVLCDRNLDTDPDGYLTGRLLHTVDAGDGAPVPGPFTVVNGVIWPHLDVDPARYRLRLLNASSTVTFDLELRGEPRGDDVALGADLRLAPGETADVVVDFAVAAGRTLTLVNTADEAAPEPEVMRFRVSPEEGRRRQTPAA